jgi:hypothetical protein
MVDRVGLKAHLFTLLTLKLPAATLADHLAMKAVEESWYFLQNADSKAAKNHRINCIITAVHVILKEEGYEIKRGPIVALVKHHITR